MEAASLTSAPARALAAGSAAVAASAATAPGSESLALRSSATARGIVSFSMIVSLESVWTNGTCDSRVLSMKMPTKNLGPLRLSRSDRPSGSVASHKGGLRAGGMRVCPAACK